MKKQKQKAASWNLPDWQGADSFEGVERSRVSDATPGSGQLCVSRDARPSAGQPSGEKVLKREPVAPPEPPRPRRHRKRHISILTSRSAGGLAGVLVIWRPSLPPSRRARRPLNTSCRQPQRAAMKPW